MRIAGIDGCKGGWIAVVLDSPFDLVAARVAAEAELGALMEECALDFALVDTPIGLADSAPGRAVEPAMRAFLKGRASVVFNAPSRASINAPSYQEAAAINRKALGKGLSTQTWGIVPKIVDADRVARGISRNRLREGHPEVSFALMNGTVPVPARKKSQEGQDMRIRLLEQAGFTPAKLLASVPVGYRAKADDLLDAAALAWSAVRVKQEQHRAFPDEAQHDALGLEMAVWA